MVNQVLHDNGSSVRVVLEDCVKTSRTCSLTLRYQLRVPPKTTFCVEFVKDAQTTSISTSSALEISFHPSITSVELDEGGRREGDGSRRELRQVLSVTCVRAFSSPPEIALTTSDRPLATTRVTLPVVTVAAFMTGLSINPDEFRQRWTALSCTEQAVASGEEVLKQREQQGGCLLGTSSVDAEPAVEVKQRGGVLRAPTEISPADVKRLLVETLGMREVVQDRPAGSVAEVALIAAAGELLLTPSSSGSAAEGGQEDEGSPAVVCLVGVELHSTAVAARVTTKSTDRVLAENVQKEVLEGIRQIRLGAGAATAAEEQRAGGTTNAGG